MNKFALNTILTLLATSRYTSAQTLQPPGVYSPLVQACGPSDGIVCVNKYASVLPYPFYRNASSMSSDFRTTSVPSDSSFYLLSNASFVIFDQTRGLELLGASPSYDFVFTVNSAAHEALVYIPALNNLYFSQLERGYLPQLVVDLDADPPTLSEYLPDPPVYAPNGGYAYANGTRIVFGAAGANASIGNPPTEQQISLRIVDPFTNTSTVILNNYFGIPFDSIDDVTVHPVTGDIFFTSPEFSWSQYLTDTPPNMPTATWRFNPSTGAVFVVEDTLSQPNGISFSPDGNTLYISDTGVIVVNRDNPEQRVGPYNPTLPHTVYAFDVTNNGTRVSNKRAFYISQASIPDGLKVSREGFVVTATGSGVDVLDEVGQLLLRVQTNYTVQNFAWTGENLTDMWMVGEGGVSRVRWNIQGQALT